MVERVGVLSTTAWAALLTLSEMVSTNRVASRWARACEEPAIQVDWELM